MSKIIELFIVLILAIVLTGCTRNTITTTPTRLPATATQTAIPYPSIIPSPTPGVTVAATTTTFTTTETSVTGNEGLTPCVNKDNPLPFDPAQRLPGTLLFNVDWKVVALDAANFTERILVDLNEQGSYEAFGLSPSDRWLALISGGPLSKGPLVFTLLSATGEVIKQQPEWFFPLLSGKEYGWAGRGWIGDQTVMITYGDDENKGGTGLFDPFTGEWRQSLIDELPGLYNREYFSGIAFSPDLTRALYVREAKTDEKPDLVLWDTIHHKELWRKIYNYGPPHDELVGLQPSAWAQDSSVIAFAYHEESDDPDQITLYLLDRDGKQLHTIRPDIPLDGVLAWNWSPDGRYIGLFSVPREDDPSTKGIVLYDRIRNSVIDICPLAKEDDLLTHLVSKRIIWSPDSRYIVFDIGPNSPEEKSKLVMLNIYTGEVRLIKRGTDYYFLVGWSAISPWIGP